MDEILEVSASSFNKIVLDSNEPVVVEFFSQACPHCRMLNPTYVELSKTLKSEALFVKVDILRSEENCCLAVNRGVRSVPTLEVFYKGRVIGNVVGHHQLDRLVESIKSFLSKKEDHMGPSTPLSSLKPFQE